MGQKSPLFTQKPSPTAAPNVSPILLCALSEIQKWSVSLRFGARPSPLASRSCSCPPLPWSAQRHLVGTTGAGGGAAERSSGGRAAGAGGRAAGPERRRWSRHRQSRRSRRPRPLAPLAGAPVSKEQVLYYDRIFKRWLEATESHYSVPRKLILGLHPCWR
jgi:hypothetical protein